MNPMVSAVALISGLSSIGYIAVIMVLFFYVWGIVGMMMFQENDPWHFGTLDVAIVTLFRCTTLEDWTDVMYTNMYGCDNWGYAREALDENGVTLCTKPQAWGAIATLYFWLLIIIGSFVIMPLFIGVVVSGMEEAVEKQKQEAKTTKKLDGVVSKLNNRHNPDFWGHMKTCARCQEFSTHKHVKVPQLKEDQNNVGTKRDPEWKGPGAWSCDQRCFPWLPLPLERHSSGNGGATFTVSDYRDLFNLIDVDDDKTLEKKEIVIKLEESLKDSGIAVDGARVDDIITRAMTPSGQSLDPDFYPEAARIDFANFVEMIHRINQTNSRPVERKKRSVEEDPVEYDSLEQKRSGLRLDDSNSLKVMKVSEMSDPSDGDTADEGRLTPREAYAGAPGKAVRAGFRGTKVVPVGSLQLKGPPRSSQLSQAL